MKILLKAQINNRNLGSNQDSEGIDFNLGRLTVVSIKFHTAWKVSPLIDWFLKLKGMSNGQRLLPCHLQISSKTSYPLHLCINYFLKCYQKVDCETCTVHRLHSIQSIQALNLMQHLYNTCKVMKGKKFAAIISTLTSTSFGSCLFSGVVNAKIGKIKSIHSLIYWGKNITLLSGVKCTCSFVLFLGPGLRRSVSFDSRIFPSFRDFLALLSWLFLNLIPVLAFRAEICNV